MFLCGLTRLASNQMFKFICSKLSSSPFKFCSVPYAVTALRCAYESKHSDPLQLTAPFTLDTSRSNLLAYDCLCLSWLLSCYPVSELKMRKCHIGDESAKLLVTHYPINNYTGQLLETLDLSNNDLTITGLEYAMKIVRASKLQYLLLIY